MVPIKSQTQISSQRPHPESLALRSRWVVFRSLLPLENKRPLRQHVNEMLAREWKAAELSSQDRAFLVYLANGVLKDWFALEALIETLSQRSAGAMQPQVRLLLKMGLYQLYAMDQVPDYAAVSTTLDLAEHLELGKKPRGLINAVLQSYIRLGKPSIPTDARWPAWWTKRLNQQLSPEQVERLGNETVLAPSLWLRVNTLKTTVEAAQACLQKQGLAFDISDELPEMLRLIDFGGSPDRIQGFEDGWFYVQDFASALVAPFVDPQPGETILEIGAAPGSKTTHMAALMHNQGRIVALDVSQKRLKRLEENLSRLGITCVEPTVGDGTQWTGLTPFDRILIDAPCSGTGTLRRHPEILMTLKESDFSAFATIQRRLLDHAWSQLKPGGVLVYSTCSVDMTENQDLIAGWLEQHPYVRLLDERVIYPSPSHDGFYMAKLTTTLD